MAPALVGIRVGDYLRGGSHTESYLPVSSGRPLDVLYVGLLPPHPGGAPLSTAGLLLGLTARGHEVRSISAMTAAALDGGDRFAREAPQLRIRRYELPYFETSPHVPKPEPYHRLEESRIRLLFDAAVAERRPDLVLVGRESYARLVPDLARRHGLPFVQRMAGAGSWALSAGAYDSALTARLLKGLRIAAARFTPAAHLARDMAELVGPIRVIPNAVDLERFRPRPRNEALARELGIGRPDVVVAHVSNLKAIKRPFDVVASATRALREEPRLFYLVVGDGELLGELQAAAVRAGIRDRFAFTGWVENERVPDYLAFADLVVMPSEYEGQSRVYLETQVAGKTLLASDIASAREVVRDGETGVLFRLGDVDELAAATVMLARRLDLRERIGARAREAVRAHDLDLAVARLERLLHEVVSGVATSDGRPAR